MIDAIKETIALRTSGSPTPESATLYVASVYLSVALTQTAAVTQKVTIGTQGVSNADVLKAIVSLIASINKQIAALQKALLKK